LCIPVNAISISSRVISWTRERRYAKGLVTFLRSGKVSTWNDDLMLYLPLEDSPHGPPTFSRGAPAACVRLTCAFFHKQISCTAVPYPILLMHSFVAASSQLPQDYFGAMSFFRLSALITPR